MTSTPLNSRIWLVALAATVALVVGACAAPAAPSPAAGDTTQATAMTAPTEAPAMAATSDTSAMATPAAMGGTTASGATTMYPITVVAGAGDLGNYMTGEDGKTLYIFKKDTANSGTSACTGPCATTWPAWTITAGETAVAGAGATGTIGTIPAGEGKMQVTYNGMPLYYYSLDQAAGDTKGQALNNVWYVAAP